MLLVYCITNGELNNIMIWLLDILRVVAEMALQLQLTGLRTQKLQRTLQLIIHWGMHSEDTAQDLVYNCAKIDFTQEQPR